MILNRIGNKKKLAHEIISHFPPHTVYLEPFFGAGGLFFQKDRVQYNLLNDIDSDVFNLYYIILTQKNKLKKQIELMPEDMNLFNFWKKNKEIDPIMQAVRFLFLSNFSYLGKGTILHITNSNQKKIILNNLENTFKFIIQDCKFTNFNYNYFFKNISFSNMNLENVFCYCDPPYINTTNNYSDSFTEKDFINLIAILLNLNIKFAISEFDTEFINEQTEKYKLNKIFICERKTIKSRNTEILITNYTTQGRLF